MHLPSTFLCKNKTVPAILYRGVFWKTWTNGTLYVLTQNQMSGLIRVDKILWKCGVFSGDYKQNLCKSNSTSCTPCPERLPTCVGVSNGPQPHPSNLWTALYIICDRNRTINIERCKEGQIFHPDLKQCVNPSAIGIILLDVCFTLVNFSIYIQIFQKK